MIGTIAVKSGREVSTVTITKLFLRGQCRDRPISVVQRSSIGAPGRRNTGSCPLNAPLNGPFTAKLGVATTKQLRRDSARWTSCLIVHQVLRLPSGEEIECCHGRARRTF